MKLAFLGLAVRVLIADMLRLYITIRGIAAINVTAAKAHMRHYTAACWCT
jgi:hypothetical protein